MKLLLQILVITIMLVALPGIYSRAQPGGTDDPEKQEEATTKLNESGPRTC